MRYVVREKFFHIGEDNDILNESGQPVFRVDGKALSLHNLMIVEDLAGTEVARVSRKLVSVLPQYEVKLAKGGSANVRKHFSPLHQKWTITTDDNQPEMEIQGNFLAHDFTVSRGDTNVATVSKQWVSMTSTYGVDVTDGQDDVLILCGVLALESEQSREGRDTNGGGIL